MKCYHKVIFLFLIVFSIILGIYVFVKAQNIERFRFELVGHPDDQINQYYKQTPGPYELKTLVGTEVRPTSIIQIYCKCHNN